MLKKSLLIVTILLLGGCSLTNNKMVINQVPKWLNNPYIEKDDVAAVGCAGIHFKGESAQKKLAISRAIDDIATQYKVKIDNVTLRKKSIYNGMKGSSSTQSSSLHSIDNLELKTKIKDIYKKTNGEICVWVVLK